MQLLGVEERLSDFGGVTAYAFIYYVFSLKYIFYMKMK